MPGRKIFKKDGRRVPLRGVKRTSRGLPQPSVRASSGRKVRSKLEARVAAWLDSRKITYQYEPLILLEGKQYRPDFFLPQFNLFLEICGFGHMPYYSDRVELKRQMYEKHGLRAIFIKYNGRGSLEKMLEGALPLQ